MIGMPLVRNVVARYLLKTARAVRVTLDRDETAKVRKGAHKEAIVGTFESSFALYRIFDGEELRRIVKTGKIIGGVFSVPLERAYGASWGGDVSAVIRWGNSLRGNRLGSDLFLAKIDALDKKFFHLGVEVQFDPQGPPAQSVVMPTTQCSTGLGCSVVDVSFNEVEYYRVDESGHIDPISDAEIRDYLAVKPGPAVDIRNVGSGAHYAGSIHGVDVQVFLEQEYIQTGIDNDFNPKKVPGMYYHTWTVSLRNDDVILKGAKTSEIAIKQATIIIKSLKPTDLRYPLDMLPLKAKNDWRKQNQWWLKQRSRVAHKFMSATVTNDFIERYLASVSDEAFQGELVRYNQELGRHGHDPYKSVRELREENSEGYAQIAERTRFTLARNLKNLHFGSHGVNVYRAVSLKDPVGFVEAMNESEQPLGKYWAYKESNARPYWGGRSDNTTVLLHGELPAESVDYEATIQAQTSSLFSQGETEITGRIGHKVYVHSVSVGSKSSQISRWHRI